VLGFVSAYYRGTVTRSFAGIVDIGLTVPGLLVLIIIAVSVKKGLTVDQMAIIVASLAWLNPRAHPRQVLSCASAATSRWLACPHERAGDHREGADAQPPAYLAATLVNTVSSAILASVGLEVLGLGPIDSPTLGMTLYWVQLQRRAHQRLVVVVDGAARDHPRRLLGLFFLTWGWTRSPTQAPESGLTADVLSVRDMSVHYARRSRGDAADSVSFGLRAGERLASSGNRVPESPRWRWPSSRMIKPPGRIDAGEIWLDGVT